MKLKVVLIALFATGLAASLASAGNGQPKDKGPGCQRVHLEGTVAQQTLTLTVVHSGPDGFAAPGSQVTLAIGSAGQPVRANVEACSTGTTLTVHQVVLHTTKPGHDSGGEHHGQKGETTTTTTTTGTTTTHP